MEAPAASIIRFRKHSTGASSPRSGFALRGAPFFMLRCAICLRTRRGTGILSCRQVIQFFQDPFEERVLVELVFHFKPGVSSKTGPFAIIKE